jgi:molybdopterin synthase catalytic subunit
LPKWLSMSPTGSGDSASVADVHVYVGPKPIDPAELHGQATDPAAGAIVQFCGAVRNLNRAAQVLALEYEAYAEMAEARIRDLVREAQDLWSLIRVNVVHRTGTLNVGETAVCVTVSAAHRDEAFAACRFLIDELKTGAPIWKKETLASGDRRWVETDGPPFTQG